MLGYLLHGRAEIQNFSLSIEKHFVSEHGERVKYFSTHKEIFCISDWPCNVLVIKSTPMNIPNNLTSIAKSVIRHANAAVVIFLKVKITCYFLV